MKEPEHQLFLKYEVLSSRHENKESESESAKSSRVKQVRKLPLK